jgi:hypothetical protein
LNGAANRKEAVMRFSEFDFDVITSPDDDPPPRQMPASPKRGDTKEPAAHPQERDRGDQPKRIASP